MRDGAYTLADLVEHRPRVRIACLVCGRRGDYGAVRLLERYGDIPAPTLLSLLRADCPRASERPYSGCRVVHVEPLGRLP